MVKPNITLKETIKLINKLKNSNCTGHDDISYKIIKKLGPNIAPHLCHLINMVLYTEIFPDIYNISRILPISKQGLSTDKIENFRPLNNFPAI